MAALVHKGHGLPEADTVLEPEYPVKYHLVQLDPGRVLVRPPHDNTLFDAPGFPEMTMADDLIFHAVILGVHAGGENQHPVRQVKGCPTIFQPVCLHIPAGHQTVLVLQVAAILPQQPEASVVDHLELPGVPYGVEIFEDDRSPTRPLADKGVEPERADALRIGGGIVRLPAGGGFLHCGLVGDATAAGAVIPYALDLVDLLAVDHGFLVVIPNMLPLDFMVLPAVGASGLPRERPRQAQKPLCAALCACLGHCSLSLA